MLHCLDQHPVHLSSDCQFPVSFSCLFLKMLALQSLKESSNSFNNQQTNKKTIILSPSDSKNIFNLDLSQVVEI